jgi:hypothetical protein
MSNGGFESTYARCMESLCQALTDSWNGEVLSVTIQTKGMQRFPAIDR